MNIRDENVLRELNLYPLWVRRDAPVLAAQQSSGVEQPALGTASRLGGGETDTQQPETIEAVMGIVEPVLSPVEGLNPCYETAIEAKKTVELDWPELKQKVRDCTACKLRTACTQTVFGVGDEKANWLFVGEGPGADEDAQGEPFVGQAGKLLDNMLMAIKLKRGSNVYIANIVKCRPPDNRTPEAGEIATCLPYLQSQITLIQPKLIVALGKTAANALLGREATLGSLRGRLHDYNGIKLLITYHPAYLLRSPNEKARAWEDLCLAVETMKSL